ncbi:response regulator receiver sensor signal transduction histidine kinase [Tolypothrix tenuis PCC 7101]|uniref:histidine kinase n=1 Tax=Tolypothrix tenuis PCC 7101 TaxID=231146 RepID=A0A1Z4MW78_9CYAN|nr:hybrid sensor histidine kinase/response regulator [Aulosira sp. FACHB-113]BAY97680.1 response regulator receiver sensor signal transduction histidine kinase [Tolypothrix tenuis PCC 7101]BAZ71813.1 response regulator receiver sensor signal transduction histidine kinase [Aulosira laxa NIES-50]
MNNTIGEPSAQGIILIVDDNPANLQVLSSFLDQSNFEVWAARSGEKALQRLENGDLPDLILLDIMMPGMDGFETCKYLKSNPRVQDIPVIFMTALSETSDKVKGLRLGAVDYITKPFQHEEVLVRIENHLQLRNLTKALISKNAELQKTQTQLIQAEKVAALGQLTAGIAHEVNNPINFIAGNLNFVEQYVQEVVSLLHLYQKHLPDPPDEIKTAIGKNDLNFLLNDLSKIIQSMQVGTSRVTEIVSSLNKFSRHREAGKKLANLYEGLESTIMILGHRFKSNGHHPPIKLVKAYADLPLIECYPGEINQVFMNLISNAIDAIEETYKNKDFNEISQNPGVIKITTEVIKEKVIIRIADNGSGINKADEAKIFDAFYTTKPIGKGTGLGLSIAYQIVVNNHNGKLTYNSMPGEGIEFILELPVR